jgi:hypothetical protein
LGDARGELHRETNIGCEKCLSIAGDSFVNRLR